jgi:hypothetical protein
MNNKLKHIGERYWEHVIEPHVRWRVGGGGGRIWEQGEQHRNNVIF